MLIKVSIDYERIYLVSDLPILEIKTGNIACHETLVNINQHIFIFWEQRYLWLRLYYLNSTFKCQITILENLADYRFSKQLFKWTFGLNKFICLAQGIMNSFKKRKGGPKDIKNLKLGTLGYPKFHKKYGYGASHSTCHLYWYAFGNSNGKGRAAVFYRLFVRNYSVECQPKNIITRINDIVKLAKKYPNKRLNVKLYSLLYDKEIYYLAYENFKSNSSNKLTNLDLTILDIFSDELILEIIKSLRDESFNFQSSRLVFISQKEKNFRKLAIAGFKDKIIQEAIKIILEAVFEPTFINNNHGYRKGKSSRSALCQINNDFKTSKWIIKCDIVNFFDNIEHDIFLFILKERIADVRLLNLIVKYLNSGYGFNSKSISYDLIGIITQDGDLNSLFSNIILNKFDQFIINLKNETDKSFKLKLNNEYQVLNLKKDLVTKKEEKLIISLENNLLNINNYMNKDLNFRKLSYVRYVDNFIIGFCGPYSESLLLSKKVEDFILKNFQLTTKINIYNFNNQTVKFLGTLITLGDSFKSKFNKSVYDQKKKLYQRIKKRILFFAPILDIKDKLINHNFMDSNNNIIPKFIWLFMDIKEIISSYNSIIKEILNYYSFVNNYMDLASLIWNVISLSCAKLLATKLKLGTAKQVFLKFGNPISFNGMSLFKPKCLMERNNINKHKDSW